ncbi:uncharacterized protein BO96DRAFT_426068 [Aspergillus niger CBS 101883]|uniref:Contig An04c0010, genomic contig n=2 Tax=Aspergillus niger TaxID=5061 RepID=A2QHJ0_ASPNC|nr:uncharacterized protein BO96DRAFT_426068 [Aspergillus niger CBS 101883]XP_059600408.1 uncharacterized protein An04g00050 [Aspergillus niger]PYH53178.1 hypothetical protein BO96DRAFT_426068 [Aspergillus niger CBS 101883]CAK38460.1 unnamed protein product [Aspergillus niger]
MALPKIACIGVIGKADNPLHVSLFPPYLESTIEFSFILNSCLDIFEIRRKQTSIDQDLGLLQAVDERLAAYGWLSTTGVKLLVIVDLIGQPIVDEDPKGSTKSGLREFDLKATSITNGAYPTGFPNSPNRICAVATESVLSTGRAYGHSESRVIIQFADHRSEVHQ